MDFSQAVDLSPKPNIRSVEETNLGIYVWEMPDGSYVGDGEGHFMMIPARKGDLGRIAKLRDAAKYYGVEEGRPVFLSNRRPVTDEEYEQQKARLELGLDPDPMSLRNQVAVLKGEPTN